MDNLSEIIKTRRSIRKFLETDISDEDIQEIIAAGVHAPSGCNSQCWRFVAVKDKKMLEKIVHETENGIVGFYNKSEFTEEFIQTRIRQITFFKNAPLVIFAFLDKMDYYDPETLQYCKKLGYSYRNIMDFLGYPDILSIGAAIQNILLTIHNKKLGACWMNDPLISQEEIMRSLNIPKEYRLISVIPVGYPAYTPRGKKMKDMHDVLTII